MSERAELRGKVRCLLLLRRRVVVVSRLNGVRGGSDAGDEGKSGEDGERLHSERGK